MGFKGQKFAVSEADVRGGIIMFSKFRKTEMKSHLNRLLLEFFWNLGLKIHMVIHNMTVENKRNIIKVLSSLLSEQFGPLFIDINLELMEQFYTKCNKSLLDNISYKISWDHLVYLIKHIPPEYWITCIETVITKGMSPDSLIEEIVHNSLIQTLILKPKLSVEQLHKIISDRQIYPMMPIVDFFKNKESKKYEKLFFLPLKENLEFDDNIELEIKNIIQAVIINVKYMQQLSPPYLNLRFILSLLDIGDRMNEFPSFHEKNNQNIFLENCSLELKKQVSKFFTLNKLLEIAETARAIKDHKERLIYAANLRWEHVILFGKFADPTVRDYFGQLAITYNLTDDSLKKEIATNMPLFLKNKNGGLANEKIGLMGKLFFNSEIYGNVLTNNLLLNKNFIHFMQ